MLLSIALIVRNEERWLGDCLESVRGIADEIVVADTGSTDRTREIASAAGARVYDIAWPGDFSQVRNQSLDLARGEWILYIDADERLRPCDRDALRAHLADPSYIAHYVTLHPRRGFSGHWVVRMFRNRPSIRFSGAVHEMVWPALMEYRAAHGGTVGYSALTIDHEGYEGDLRVKHRRNIPLLHQRLREEPGHIYCWCHLAECYEAVGRQRLALRTWRHALDLVRQGAPGKDDSLPYIALIQHGCAKGEDVADLVEEAIARCPYSPQLRWMRGRVLISAGEFERALPEFERLVTMGKSDLYSRPVACDMRILNVHAFASLATCYFRLGRYSEGRRYYEMAAEADPVSLEYRAKRDLCKVLEAR